MDHPDLKAETEAILTEGGALAAIVTQEGDAWTVSAAFPCRGYAADGRDGMSGEYGPKPYTGNTRRTGGDPRDLAAHFVADAAAHRAKMDAFFAPPAAGSSTSGNERDDVSGGRGDDESSLVAPDIVGDEAGRDDDLGPIDADFGELDAPATDASFLIDNRPDDIEVEEPEAPHYPGVIVLSDEISDRRAQVITAITVAEHERLLSANDPSRADTLRQAFVDYMNAGALGHPISDTTRQYYQEYMEASNRADAIRNHADTLRRTALDASGDMLLLMYEQLGDGWP